MFAKIRNQLTLLYTGIMALFLLAFVGASYFGLKWAINHQEKEEVQLLVEEEAEENREILKRGVVVDKKNNEGVDDNDLDNNEKIFYYAMNNDGNPLAADEPSLALRASILDIIRSGQVTDGEAVLQALLLPGDQKVTVVIAARNVYEDRKLLGTVYLGKNITEYYRILERLLIILLVISLVLLIFASGAGHLLAGRAMIPINRSYTRQREFVADASHELRTPLSILLASVDAIQGDTVNKMSSFSKQVLGDMKDEVRKMSKIVSDLLTLARADAGAMNLLKEKFDLKPVAEQVFRSLLPLANDKHIDLKLYSDAHIPVYADKERLSQLILILADNGIKYTAAGGFVRIFLELVSEANGNQLKIEVQDNGIGIEPEYKDLIFERFYRIDKARSRAIGGTGLGLSIAQWIVKTHEGTIDVESMPGKGTKFTVSIPV